MTSRPIHVNHGTIKGTCMLKVDIVEHDKWYILPKGTTYVEMSGARRSHSRQS